MARPSTMAGPTGVGVGGIRVEVAVGAGVVGVDSTVAVGVESGIPVKVW